MEEKTKYKKCPYCELNYITTTDHCCKVCYANSQTARNEAILQRKRQRLEIERIQEHNNRRYINGSKG